METMTQTFKALSEPVRIRILNLLLDQPSLCVCDLVSVLDMGQSTVSRHLAYLKNAGLVDSWREATWIHYALRAEALKLLNQEVFRTELNSWSETQNDLDKLHAYLQQPRNCQI